MKLNIDCIRDILLTIEEETGYEKYMTYNPNQQNYKLLNNYEGNEIMYHILQCKNANLIECEKIDLAGNVLIKDLTIEGHKFIANIRENNNWNKVKDISKKVGAASIDVIKDIAASVISAAISSTLKP